MKAATRGNAAAAHRLLATLAIGALLGACASTAPVDMRTGAVGPAVEGRHIVIRGVLNSAPVDDRPWGWKLFVDDGSGPLLVFITVESQIDVSSLRAGQQLRVRGAVGRYEQHLELLPRVAGDLQLLP